MLNRVTFTGIDNKTNINDLVLLSKKYPFVEFGVLFSTKQPNDDKWKNRYPDKTILKKLKNKELQLCGHVCGSAVRKIVKENNWNEFYNLFGDEIDIFNRFQLNVADVKCFFEKIDFPKDRNFIIQLNKNLSLYEKYKDLPNVFGFQDNSGGLGKFENNWLDSDRYFGYAGGLNVDNVEDVINNLYIVNNADFWIDMETSVRTNDWFDVEKCEKILEICKNYVNKKLE